MKISFGIGLGSSTGLLGGADTQKFMELVRMHYMRMMGEEVMTRFAA